MANILEQIKREIQEQQAAQNGDLLDLDLEALKIIKFDTGLTNLFQSQQQLQSLSLVECQLKTLTGLPNLPNLQNLVLEANQLDGEAVTFIANTYKQLVCLSLAENQIQTLKDLEPLKQLKKLQQLDLSENPVASQPQYFKKVFDLIPGLKVLDNKDKDGNLIEYSDDEDGEDDLDNGELDEDLDDDDDLGDEDDDDEDESDPKPVKKTKK